MPARSSSGPESLPSPRVSCATRPAVFDRRRRDVLPGQRLEHARARTHRTGSARRGLGRSRSGRQSWRPTTTSMPKPDGAASVRRSWCAKDNPEAAVAWPARRSSLARAADVPMVTAPALADLAVALLAARRSDDGARAPCDEAIGDLPREGRPSLGRPAIGAQPRPLMKPLLIRKTVTSGSRSGIRCRWEPAGQFVGCWRRRRCRWW